MIFPVWILNLTMYVTSNTSAKTMGPHKTFFLNKCHTLFNSALTFECCETDTQYFQKNCPMYFQRARQKSSTLSSAKFKCTFYLCDGFSCGLPTESAEAFSLRGANRSVIAVRNVKNSQRISGENPFYYTSSLL